MKPILRRIVLPALLATLGLATLASTSHAGDAASQPKSGYVTAPDGVKIHYLEAGTRNPAAPSILFVPGWTMPAWIWEQQIAHFSKTHRVVAMDPRSQGQSDQPADGHFPAARAADIKAVVDQLKLAPVVLVGWSMGVTEAVAYVDQFGTDTLAALVLVDGFAGSDFDPVLSPQMLRWANSFQLDRPKAVEAFVRNMYFNPAVKEDEAYLRRVMAASLRTPTNSAMALILAYFATDLRPALARIDKPTLIVVAQSPWMKYYEEVQRLTSGSRLEVFDGAGHALFVDAAARFNALLGDFVAALAHH